MDVQLPNRIDHPRPVNNQPAIVGNDLASINPDYFQTVIEFENMPTEAKYMDSTLKFFPPMYVQRYEAVSLLLRQLSWYNSIQKAVDFGCSEMNYFLHLKHIPGITEILEVDIDENILRRFATKAAPLNADYFFSKRTKQLNVTLLAGNIAQYDDRLQDTDVVVALEVLEHMNEDDLKLMPNNIFHNVKPRVAIFTTPNADFNVLFPNLNTFRHPDHKFEWTRMEFYRWTQEIISQYPNYTVKLYGVGVGPENTEHLGCCSQIAVFERNTDNEEPETSRRRLGIDSYKFIRDYVYPVKIDDRTNEMKIFQEVEYRLKFNFRLTKLYNFEEEAFEIPLSEMYPFVNEWCESEDELSQILMDYGFQVVEMNGVLYLLYRGYMSDREIYPGDYDGFENDYIQHLEEYDLTNVQDGSSDGSNNDEDKNDKKESANADTVSDSKSEGDQAEIQPEDISKKEETNKGAGLGSSDLELMEECIQVAPNEENVDMDSQSHEFMEEGLQVEGIKENLEMYPLPVEDMEEGLQVEGIEENLEMYPLPVEDMEEGLQVEGIEENLEMYPLPAEGMDEGLHFEGNQENIDIDSHEVMEED